ncbi:class GN sortase [Limibacillus sp. MBR-115]|jgi:sortase A|uniref:class GN sortase n=1 Tax=Limibacillus sp. MBR-115 TaxID=3156465 RepID=UPI003398F3E0
MSANLPRQRARLLLPAALLLVLAGWQLGGAALLQAKAWLAPLLIAEAWEESLESQSPVPPWPWSDTYPVARLDIPSLGISRYVLAGTGGDSLAFGPGHLTGSALPGSTGHSVLAAHRDSHFAFLKDLKPGDKLRLQGPDGGWHIYEMEAGRLIDTRRELFRFDPDRPALTLVTCYPFDGFDPNTPLRYLVRARQVAAN